jgi:hypothetical protein
VAAILGANCEPIFCDVDPANGSVFDTEWARAREMGASVALVVHLYGNPVDIIWIRRHFSSPNCLVIEDAAQALGAFNATGFVGGQGDVGILSFGKTKHIEIGGAALLFSDSQFAETVADTLKLIAPVTDMARLSISNRFRVRLEVARARLRSEGDAAAIAFHGLLDGYFSSLQIHPPTAIGDAACLALDTYPHARQQRIDKAKAWSDGLAGSGLKPIGMSEGSVPWRYTCRLPGINWDRQFRLGEQMRLLGVNVSHWYLPTHWMCGYGQHTLPGTECLAQEVFQFWVDSRTSLATIKHDAALVATIVKSNTTN